MRCGPAVLLLQCVSEFFSLFLSYTPTPPPPPAPFFLFPFSPTLSRPRHPVLTAQLFLETRISDYRPRSKIPGFYRRALVSHVAVCDPLFSLSLGSSSLPLPYS